jgi:hypothetical protein
MDSDISRTPLCSADVPHITQKVPVLAAVHVTSVCVFVKIGERNVSQQLQVQVMVFR